MAAEITAEIARLATLSRPELVDLWHKLYGRVAPPGIRRTVLVPFLAYRLQEKAYGGLKPSTCTELRRIARALEKGSYPAGTTLRPRIKAGTRILRQWKGKSIEVTVTESGFECGRKNYRSLSQIARKITGTRWSGPAFFGLRSRRAMKGPGNG
jgi:hypothetical protein